MVKDAERRLEAARLYEAMIAAQEAVGQAVFSPIPSDIKAAIDAANEACDADVERLRESCRKQVAELRAQAGNGDADRLREAAKAAEEAYEQHDAPALLTRWEDETIIRCGITNLPIFETDEYVTDDETGEHWLRSALNLPPRPEMEVEADEEEVA